MSLVALDWMMAEAEQCGLRFIQVDREYVHTYQDVHDELYDARAGLGVYYRWEPRDLIKLCHAHNIACPKIHISVFERIANGTGRYAPINLPHHYEVVRTNDERSWPSDPTLWAIERQVPHGAHSVAGPPKNESLLEGMTGTVRSGKMSYYTFVAASIPAIGWWYALPPFPQVAEALVNGVRILISSLAPSMPVSGPWCGDGPSASMGGWNRRLRTIGSVFAKPYEQSSPTAKFNEGLNPHIRWQEWGEA